MKIFIAIIALGSGILAADPPATTSSVDARIIQAVLNAPAIDLPPANITLDRQRFAYTPFAGGWSPEGAWSSGVLDEVARIRPDMRFCEESFETFDRCVSEDEVHKAHAVVGEITEMSEGQFTVRVLFLQRFPSVHESRSLLSLQDWEYRVSVDGAGRVSVLDRTRIART